MLANAGEGIELASATSASMSEGELLMQMIVSEIPGATLKDDAEMMDDELELLL